MIRLVEIKKSTYDRLEENVQYKLEEVWINPQSILQIKPDVTMKNNLQAGYLPKDLDSRQEFSRVHVGGGNGVSVLTVVGSPPTVIEKMDTANKQLLKG
jgi:hypothetical protein